MKKVWTVAFRSKTHDYVTQRLCVRAATAGMAENKANRIAEKVLRDYPGGSRTFRVVSVEHTLDLDD